MQNNIASSKELIFADLIKITKKRAILLSTVLISGIILITLFFTFKYPPEALSSRIFSDDLGNIFSIINSKNSFLSPDDINKLIDPIIQLNIEKKKKYKISVKNTFKKGKIHNSVVGVLDLNISRKFAKYDEKSKVKFTRDIEDFFRKFEHQLFLWFVYREKIEKLKIIDNIIKKKKAIEEEEKKISIVKKFKDIPSENYRDILDIDPSYLPPSQQYYGLVIEMNNQKRLLDLFNEALIEIDGILKIISDKELSLFSEIVIIKDLKQYEILYNRVKLISENIRILKNKLILRGFYRSENIPGIYLIVFSFLILFIFLVILISFIEWWSKNKDKINIRI